MHKIFTEFLSLKEKKATDIGGWWIEKVGSYQAEKILQFLLDKS